MKTVGEVRKIVEAVKARGDVAAKDEELPCDECPAEGDCESACETDECVEVLEAWLKQQDAAK